MRINLLGGFELRVDGEPVRVPEASQRLIVFLALRERPQPRLAIAGHLWPEKTDGRAAANLRSSLWRCRCPSGASIVVPDGMSLRLVEGTRLDVAEMEAAGWALVRNGAPELVDEVDRRLFYWELLPGWYDDFVVFERERLLQLQVHFLDALARALHAADRHVDALDVELRRKHLAD